MALKLNETPETYKEFYGRNTEQMPKLIAEGRIPLSVAGLMERKLDMRNSSDNKVKSAWIDNSFTTGDVGIYHPDGKVKVVLDSQHLRDLTTQSKLKRGALVLEDRIYEQLEGQEFTRKELEKYTGNDLSKKQAKTNPILKTLARDQGLLNDYVDYIFVNCNANMGVHLDSVSDNLKLRAWHIGGLFYGPVAYCGDVLNSKCARLVGLTRKL